MNRRHFIQTGSIATGGILLTKRVSSFSPLVEQKKASQLTILHTNDVHSRLDPFPMDGSKYEGMGGVVNRKKAIDSMRANNRNVLLLDSGDMFQGTPYFNLYKGEPEIKVMSALGYDAGTIGNHDFDGGLDNLALQLQHANFPIVNCNYNFNGTNLEEKIPPFTIVKKGGLTIGIIGVGIQLKGLVLDSLCEGVVWQNPIEKANYYAHYLKTKKRCDMVVCLSHLGYEYAENNKLSDRTFVPSTKNIDVVLGGHTHTFLEKPVSLKNADGKEVVIHQVGWAGIQLGCLEFDFFQQNDSTSSLKGGSGIFL
jgi:5'-nucleotidase